MKKLISFDQVKYNHERDLIASALEDAEQACQAFNALGVCSLNESLFKAAVSARHDELETALSEGISEQLQKSKLTIGAIRESAIEKCLYSFRDNVQPLWNALRQNYRSVLPYISFENGKPTFNKESEKLLKERFSIYCNSDESLALHALHGKLVDVVNEFCIKFRMSATDFQSSFFQNLITFDHEKMQWVPRVLNYDFVAESAKAVSSQ